MTDHAPAAQPSQPTPPPTQRYVVPDQYDVVEFDGWRLAHARTDADPREPRWTELTVYRTVAGQYVVQKVGKSLVFHDPRGACNRGVATDHQDLPDDAVPCPRCLAGPDALDGADEVDLELDRNAVVVCARPQDVAPALLVRRHDGARVMSGVSQRVLDLAVEVDDDLYEAVNSVRRVD